MFVTSLFPALRVTPQAGLSYEPSVASMPTSFEDKAARSEACLDEELSGVQDGSFSKLVYTYTVDEQFYLIFCLLPPKEDNI